MVPRGLSAGTVSAVAQLSGARLAAEQGGDGEARPARAEQMTEVRRHRGDYRGGDVAETYNGYCVKCKEKRDFEGEVSVSESGRKMAKGICPVCGTKMNRILGKA
jgi:hypothetical protein